MKKRSEGEDTTGIEGITGYDGDIYAFVAELAGALDDDEAIPDDLVDELISSTIMSKLPPEPTSKKLRVQ
jgi:hypothetical protein